MAILRSDGRAWRDRVVVVTGGTSGIGREFAVRLAAEGAKVIACARNEVALRELHTRYPQIEAIRCDVTVPPTCWRSKPPFRTATAGSMS